MKAEDVLSPEERKKLSPEAKLILEIIASGVREDDVEYFESEVFYQHCRLLKLSSEKMLDVYYINRLGG